MTAASDPETRRDQPEEVEDEHRDAGVAIPVDAALAADVLAEESTVETAAEEMTHDHGA